MHAHTQRRTHTHTHMHSQPCTNANCRKMLMPVIISEPPLSFLQQHSFRGHRSEKESVPSWLLLIGQTGRLFPGYQLTLTTQRGFSVTSSFSKWFLFSFSSRSSRYSLFFLTIIPFSFQFGCNAFVLWLITWSGYQSTAKHC